MLSLDQDFRDLLSCLNSAGVRYLVIGGYAVNFHGYTRNTKDLDIWIALEPDNARRVSMALQAFGFSASSVPYKKFLDVTSIHAFGREPIRVDLLLKPSGVEFESCYARRIEAKLEGVSVPVISLKDLRQNKGASGRTKDLADLENLPRKVPNAKKARRRKK